MLVALALGFAVGAPAALLVRSGPLPARIAALLAMAVVGFVALVPPDARSEQVPARVAVVSTAAPGQHGVAKALRAQAAAAKTPPAALALIDGSSDLRAALARAAIAAGSRAEDLAVVWNGRVAPGPAPGPVPVAGAFTTTPALPWPPSALQARPLQAAVVGRPLRFEVSVAGAGAPVDVAVKVEDRAGELTRQHGTVPAHGGFECECTPRGDGPLSVTVTATAAGHRIVRRGRLAVTAEAPVLVLDPSGVAAAALRAQGIALLDGAALPADLAGQALAIVGGPLPVGSQKQLAAAVERGLGLFLLGPGLQAEGEPLRELLPVRVRRPAGEDASGAAGGNHPAPQPPQPPPRDAAEGPPKGRTEGAEIAPGGPVEVDKRAIAMVLCVDRSGSMGEVLPGGATKMSYAKTSALETARALGEGDEVAIVTFGNKGQGRVVLPLVPATDRLAVERGIAALAEANEYTFLLAGLRAADQLLTGARAAVRHVVVITDGEFYLDEEVALRSLAHEMRARGITLSIVSIVARDTRVEFRRAAELLAREGGGAFVPVQDPRSVPIVVSAEVTRALDRVGRRPGGDGPSAQTGPEPKPPQPPEPPPPAPDREEKPSGPSRLVVRAVARSPLLQPEPEKWPTLGGIVDAAARPDAQVLLVAGDHGEPLLAYRNVGLGRVAVFASDLGGAQGAEFRAEAAFPGRFAQWVTALRAPLPRPLPGDLLTETEVAPPAPEPGEAAALAAIGGGALLPFDRLRLPPPALEIRYLSRVPGWAAGALVALLLLATVETWLQRRLPG